MPLPLSCLVGKGRNSVAKHILSLPKVSGLTPGVSVKTWILGSKTWKTLFASHPGELLLISKQSLG